MDRQIAHKISVQVGFPKKQILKWCLAGIRFMSKYSRTLINIWKERREGGK